MLGCAWRAQPTYRLQLRNACFQRKQNSRRLADATDQIAADIVCESAATRLDSPSDARAYSTGMGAKLAGRTHARYFDALRSMPNPKTAECSCMPCNAWLASTDSFTRYWANVGTTRRPTKRSGIWLHRSCPRLPSAW